MSRVIVCGGRGLADEQGVFDALRSFHLCTDGPITELICGGATGADSLAAAWALLNPEIKLTVMGADWKAHGRAAGPIRNEKMLSLAPDRVLAFPGGKGTADMVRRAKAAHVPVEFL